jgi:hypothetical protein
VEVLKDTIAEEEVQISYDSIHRGKERTIRMVEHRG